MHEGGGTLFTDGAQRSDTVGHYQRADAVESGVPLRGIRGDGTYPSTSQTQAAGQVTSAGAGV